MYSSDLDLSSTVTVPNTILALIFCCCKV